MKHGILLLILSTWSLGAAQTASTAAGRRLYANYCANCHGANAEGARGPALARERLSRATTQAKFIEIVQQGVPDTEMPPTRLSESECVEILAYVRSLAAEFRAGAGDSERGRALYDGKGGCARCHMIGGAGGRLGPELTAIGAMRSASYLRRALIDPQADLPNQFAQYRLVIPMPDNFLMVHLRTHDARTVRGVRLNEDPFSIQVRDLSDKLHSFAKSELAELRREPGVSPMPSFREVFGDDELGHLVAYLLTLREAR